MELSFGIHYLHLAFPNWSDTQVVCEDVKDICKVDLLSLKACKRHEFGNGGKTQTFFGT